MLHLKLECFPRERLVEDPHEVDNRISDANFLIVFYIKCLSILLSFRYITMDGRRADGRTTGQ